MMLNFLMSIIKVKDKLGLQPAWLNTIGLNHSNLMALPAINHEEQAERQAALEQRYSADGRYDVEHPMNGLYTGLVNQPFNIREVFLAWWKESYSVPSGSHALMTHVAFGEHIAELMQILGCTPLPEEKES